MSCDSAPQYYRPADGVSRAGGSCGGSLSQLYFPGGLVVWKPGNWGGTGPGQGDERFEVV